MKGVWEMQLEYLCDMEPVYREVPIYGVLQTEDGVPIIFTLTTSKVQGRIFVCKYDFV